MTDRDRTGVMEPPSGFLERAVRRGLAAVAMHPDRADLDRNEVGEDEAEEAPRRDSGFFELEEGPPTLPFIRPTCG